jgi:hypothetical protein
MKPGLLGLKSNLRVLQRRGRNTSLSHGNQQIDLLKEPMDDG